MSESASNLPQRLLAWTAFVTFCALIVYNSHHPGSPDYIPPFPHHDKVQHFGAYLILTVLCLWAFFTVSVNARRVFLAAGLFTIVFAVSDEWHQSFIPLRHASVLDVLADLAGGGAGARIYSWARRRQSTVEGSDQKASF